VERGSHASTLRADHNKNRAQTPIKNNVRRI
jgi:hypothetical protein